MGRDGHGLFRVLCFYVSTHAPAWGATMAAWATPHRRGVSTHAPAWGATGPAKFNYRRNEFQPTRPHGARRGLCGNTGRRRQVSTHAPAWGATQTETTYSCGPQVSTHAPAWGATRAEINRTTGAIQFQPTRPHGARHDGANVIYTHDVVSTHAPAWGATARTSQFRY